MPGCPQESHERTVALSWEGYARTAAQIPATLASTFQIVTERGISVTKGRLASRLLVRPRSFGVKRVVVIAIPLSLSRLWWTSTPVGRFLPCSCALRLIWGLDTGPGKAPGEAQSRRPGHSTTRSGSQVHSKRRSRIKSMRTCCIFLALRTFITRCFSVRGPRGGLVSRRSPSPIVACPSL